MLGSLEKAFYTLIDDVALPRRGACREVLAQRYFFVDIECEAEITCNTRSSAHLKNILMRQLMNRAAFHTRRLILIVPALILGSFSFIPQAHAAVSFAQQNAKSFQSTATAGVNFNSATVAGDLIVVGVYFGKPSSIASVTDSQGNTYTQIGSVVVAPGGMQSTALFYAKNIFGGAETVTVSLNGVPQFPGLAIYIFEYKGINRVDPLDGNAQAAGTSSLASSGNITTTVAGDLLFGFCVSDSSCTAGSGFIARSRFENNLGEDETLSNPGSYSATATSNAGWTMQAAAFKPSSSDTTPPTNPTGLTATPVSASQITLSWTASTDDVGVNGYRIYRDGIQVGTSAITSYSDKGLNPATTYSYSVSAYDGAGNVSGLSAPASATTPSPDAIPPSLPPGLTAAAVSSTQINLSWNASTDNVGVAGYRVFRNGTQVGTTSQLSYSDTALTASTTYSYTVSAFDASGNDSGQTIPVNATTQGQSGVFGLDFPGNAGVKTTMRFRFLNPLAIYPATYIWKAYPRQQNGYYTTFFWGNDNGCGCISDFSWDNGKANTFYGAHPYPYPDTLNHKWEIATDQGTDWLSNQDVVYNRWYTQALVAWADSQGYKHTTFYWDLPDTTKVVDYSTQFGSGAAYGNTYPPNPALTFGDAPWGAGHEVYDGILRGIQIYSVKLSLSDIQSEANSPLSTSAGASSIWYMNLNPTPADILDKSGAGHNPSWVGSERPSLYSDGSVLDTTAPSVPANLTATAVFNTQINLSWSASTDNVGVSGYKIFRNNIQTGTSTTTSFSDMGLAASTTYSYTVSAFDAAGNESARSSPVTATTLDPNSVPPSVSITAPVAGSTVSGNTTLSASVSGNVAIAGVQFMLDGVNLGTEVTTAPYNISWNTFATSNGSHALSATARDTAGNTTTSNPVAVTVQNATNINYVQSAASTNNNAATSIAQTFPSANAAGSLIVVAVSWGNNATLNCSDSRGNTYAVATTQYDNINHQSLAICYAMNVNAGINTVTASFSSSASYRRILVHEYQGVATTNALDATAQNIANATTAANGVSSTSATTTADGDLIFSAVMDDSGVNNIAAGSGFVPRASVNNKDLASEDQVQASAGPIAATYTFTAGHRYLAQMAIFKHQ